LMHMEIVAMAGTGCEVDHEVDDEGGAQGRWTREEHKLFLEAIQLYGREWRMVQTAVKTRTSAQIRSHAQKYFQKVSKQEPARFLSGACEDAFLILEMCERVLHMLKQKRDDILQRDGGRLSVSSSDDHGAGASYDQVDLDLNDVAAHATATATATGRTARGGAWCVPAPALTLTLCRDGSSLEDDELIALEVLCAGREFVKTADAGPAADCGGKGDVVATALTACCGGVDSHPVTLLPIVDVCEYGFQWAQKGAVALHVPTRVDDIITSPVPGDMSRKRPLQIDPLYYATNLAAFKKRLKPL